MIKTICVALVALTALASSPPAEAADPASSSSLRVIKDPVTGQLRMPTAAEAAAMDAEAAKLKSRQKSALTNTDGEDAPPEFEAEGGLIGAPMNETGLSYSVAYRKTDGSIELRCTQGKAAAERIVSGNKLPLTAIDAREHRHEDR